MALKIEDVKVGDELVCIDREGYADYCRNEERCTPIDTENLIYSKFYNPSAYAVTNNGNIYQDAFKFFKKKEQSQYTFDDLIDVAVQSYKDGVATIKIDTKLQAIFIEELKTTYGVGHIDLGIKYIQSLYKETFTIESEDDIKLVNPSAKIRLSNNIELWVKEANGSNYINACEIGSVTSNSLNFISLKGATVTQPR